MSRKVKAVIVPGRYVWIACDVKPGPFSDERMVRVASSASADVWVGFASVSALRNPIKTGQTAIKALVIGVLRDRFEAQPMGSSLNRTLLLAKVSEAELVA